VLGGVLMGLANLVPGVSGGTMLLATGIYPRFIAAVAELTRFRFRLRSIVLLAAVVVAAGVAVLALAGPVRDLVVERRWSMYSLFIGLTLGGVPIVWRLLKPPGGSVWAGAVAGFALMVAMLFVQPGGGGSGDGARVLFFFGGLAGASAMILPGVSGGYLLLVLGLPRLRRAGCFPPRSVSSRVQPPGLKSPSTTSRHPAAATSHCQAAWRGTRLAPTSTSMMPTTR
jgi:putative membrane protein